MRSQHLMFQHGATSGHSVATIAFMVITTDTTYCLLQTKTVTLCESSVTIYCDDSFVHAAIIVNNDNFKSCSD